MLSRHRTYVGTWLNVRPPGALYTHVGVLSHVTQRAGHALVHIKLRTFTPTARDGDCRVTGRPILRQVSAPAIDIALEPGTVVDVVLVTRIRNTFRWNDKVKPLRMIV